MPDGVERGLLDTSVVLDLETIPVHTLPGELAICAVTLAELAAAPAATTDPAERARRQDRLQRAEAAFEPIPFELEAARAYGQIYAAVVARVRTPRRRLADLFIASVAVAEGLPVITRNPDDFAGLDDLVQVVTV
ncbi:type II toxin-antitoxin system VapC family toxin [Isoptericola sp. S6320L]|uniref:type II toxin-antitoxin system VapC family toxin n=1 Tax=Isoptericola sp. S6320L TaxID=2926411 RepID=UPI001FF3AAB7|nr:type II toxin-antitoxin system VapC family toxin [Isoptericola sp. S6320L]MCK0117211.1 type II toxin-antitoxin system VapC family toxin [Isoptericola sp. S6320L]